MVRVAVGGGEEGVGTVDPREDGHEPRTQPQQPRQSDHTTSSPHCGLGLKMASTLRIIKEKTLYLVSK